MSHVQNRRRVGIALDHLHACLGAFVVAGMERNFGTTWLAHVSRSVGADPNDADLDPYALLKTLLYNWHGVFRDQFGRTAPTVKTYVSTAFDARNTVAHHKPCDDAAALRYLDAICQLLEKIDAPSEELAAARELYKIQRLTPLDQNAGSRSRPDDANERQDRLEPGQVLHRGHSLTSSNGRFTLTLHEDGHLILRDHEDWTWTSATPDSGGERLEFQHDGNLVLRNAEGDSLWHSGTHGHRGICTVVQDDGNTVIYANDGDSVWHTDTVRC